MNLSALLSLTGKAEQAAVLVVLAGGILLFVVGRRRGTLSGAGLVVLAAGMLAGYLPLAPLSWIAAQLHVTVTTVGLLHSGVLLLLNLGGWALVLVALFRFRAVKPEGPDGAPSETDG